MSLRTWSASSCECTAFELTTFWTHGLMWLSPILNHLLYATSLKQANLPASGKI